MAPTTGAGIAASTAASFGKNASAITINPAGSAIDRLVVPVASDNPTLLDTVFCATPPVKPENSVPRPLARMPPLMDFISVRFQSASLIFWQRVISPTVFKLAVKQAITKGATSESRKLRPETTRWGTLIHV